MSQCFGDKLLGLPSPHLTNNKKKKKDRYKYQSIHQQWEFNDSTQCSQHERQQQLVKGKRKQKKPATTLVPYECDRESGSKTKLGEKPAKRSRNGKSMKINVLDSSIESLSPRSQSSKSRNKSKNFGKIRIVVKVPKEGKKPPLENKRKNLFDEKDIPKTRKKIKPLPSNQDTDPFAFKTVLDSLNILKPEEACARVSNEFEMVTAHILQFSEKWAHRRDQFPKRSATPRPPGPTRHTRYKCVL